MMNLINTEQDVMMIIEVLAVIVSIVIFLLFMHRKGKLSLSIFGGIIFGAIFYAFSLIVTFIVLGEIGNREIRYEDTELQAVSIGTETRGNFLRISPDLTYSFFVKTEDGGLRSDHISDDNVVVYEDDSVTPMFREIIEVTDGGPWTIWSDEYTAGYAFFVPVGSVVQDYTLDLH